jgi:hypothetical protein
MLQIDVSRGEKVILPVENCTGSALSDGYLGGVLICASSLCNLGVLCVSVVNVCCESVNHRDTENTEVAQRNQIETLPIFGQD